MFLSGKTKKIEFKDNEDSFCTYTFLMYVYVLSPAGGYR